MFCRVTPPSSRTLPLFVGTTLFLLLSVLMVACASGPQVNDGNALIVTSPDSLYPEDNYLIAVGTGNTRAKAEMAAAAGLARIFRSDIVVDIQTRQAYRTLLSDSELTGPESEIIQSISISTDQQLVNVKYSDAFVDANGDVHIVAYIDRDETGIIYRDLIRKNNMRVENLYAVAESVDSVLTSYPLIQNASLISLANEILLEQLSIINSQIAQIVRPRISPVQIETKKQELQLRMVFRIEIDGDEGQIAAFIREGLTRANFASQRNGILLIRGSIIFEEGTASGKYATVIWKLTLNLINENGNMVATVEVANRERALDIATAELLATQTIKKLLSEDLMERLLGDIL